MVVLIISADLTNSSVSITTLLLRAADGEERRSRLPSSRRDHDRFECVREWERERERDLDSCEVERERRVETSFRFTFSGGRS